MQPRQSTWGQQGGPPRTPRSSGREAQPGVGGARGPVLDLKEGRISAGLRSWRSSEGPRPSPARSTLRCGRDPRLRGSSNPRAGADGGGGEHTKERDPRSTAVRSPFAHGARVGTARRPYALTRPAAPREGGWPHSERRVPAGSGPPSLTPSPQLGLQS